MRDGQNHPGSHRQLENAVGDGNRQRDLVWIALLWAMAALLLRPFQNTPFVDDWVYAWSVERLLRGQGLWVLDYSTSLNPSQTLWGALFCVPFGFSFVALRISTWVAALLGLCGMYVLLRDQGVSRGDTVLATACLGVQPIFFILSMSFMTDIPFVASVIWATVAFLRGIGKQSDGWLWTAVALSCAGVGVRITAVVVPIAMTLTLLLDRRGWGRRRGRFLWPMITLLFFTLIVWWFQQHTEFVADLTDVPNAPGNRVRALKEQALRLLPIMSVCAATFAAGALGVAVLPVSATMLSRRRLGAAVIAMATLSVAVIFVNHAGQSHFPPLTAGQTWAPGELGATEPLIPDHHARVGSTWLVWIVTVFSLASASVLLTRSPLRLDSAHLFLLLQLLGQVTLIALLWLFYDRYALVLVPIALAWRLRNQAVARPRLAAALMVVLGIVTLVGTRDHLDYNRAVWTAVAYLETLGVEPAEFDGGYTVNGWLQYAHPERARRDATGAVAVPHINILATTTYRISNDALPTWRVLTSVPYTRWAGRSGHLYVLKREEGSTAPGHDDSARRPVLPPHTPDLGRRGAVPAPEGQ